MLELKKKKFRNHLTQTLQTGALVNGQMKPHNMNKVHKKLAFNDANNK